MDQAESLRNQMRTLNAAPNAGGRRIVAVTGAVDQDWQSWFCRGFADAWSRAGGRACVVQLREPCVDAPVASASYESSAADLWVVDYTAPSHGYAVPYAADEVLLLATPSARSVAQTYLCLMRLVRDGDVHQVGLVVGRVRQLVQARHVAVGLQRASMEYLEHPLTIVGFVLEPRAAAPSGAPGPTVGSSSLVNSCFDQLVANYRRARRLAPGFRVARGGRGG